MLGGASQVSEKSVQALGSWNSPKPPVWSLRSAQTRRGCPAILYLPHCLRPVPPTDWELLGNKCCLAGVTPQSALLGAGLREHLLLDHLVSSVAPGPRPASTDPATAGNACRSPPSLTSLNQLVEPQSLRLCPLPPKEPEISGIPSSAAHHSR